MAKFQIATPGGYEVEVTAENQQQAIKKAKDNWQTMPRIVAKQDKTRIFERPSGQRYLVSPGYSTSDPQKIEQALQGMTGGEISRQSIDESIIDQYPVTSRAAQVVKGVPFLGSYADEAIGAAAGQEAATGVRAAQGAMERQRPGETLALNLAGGLAGSAGMAAAAPAKVGQVGSQIVGSGSRLSRVARGGTAGAALGGIEGAVYGAGEGTTAEERAQGAQTGARFGATFGGLLGGAAPVASDMIENVANTFKRTGAKKIAKDLGISTDAAKVIKSTFDEGGDIDAARTALQRAGDEGMLADAGPAAQALLDASAASGGRAAETTTTAINNRMARTSTDVTGTMDDVLGEAPLGPRTAVRQIAERTSDQRADLYGRAYSSPINYETGAPGEKVLSVIDRVPPRVLSEAIAEANEDMAARGLENQQIMASIADDGRVTFQEMPNVQQLDELKKGLQAIAYDNTDDFGRLNQRGRRYQQLASEIRDAVSEAAPVYGDAVALGGDKLAEERAFKLGRNILRPQTEIEDVVSELGDNPSIAQIDAAKMGLRNYIDKTLGDVRAIASDPGADALEARQVVKAVTDLSSDNARQKVRQLLGAEADTLLSKIDEAAQSSSVRAALAQNSKTAVRQAQQGAVEEITSPGVVGTLGRGDPINTSRQLVQAVTGMTDEFNAKQRQKVYQDIARALTEKQGVEAQRALSALQAAIGQEQISEEASEQLAQMLAVGLYGGGTAATTRGATAEDRAR
jgi:hypothetical protein